jgi:rod shape-determining protein MreC
MQKKEFLPPFVVFLVISLSILILSKFGFLSAFSPLRLVSPFQALFYSVGQRFERGQNQSILKLQDENTRLSKALVSQKEKEKENQALLDQFQTSYPRSSNLLPAKILGAPSFIGGDIEYFILDKGSKDGVKEGQAVVFKDNLVGKIVSVSSYFSKANLVSQQSSSFLAKVVRVSQTGEPLGIVKGEGQGGIFLDNVILSENLKPSDLVVTKGDLNSDGQGYPPDIIVGKIVSVSKNPSSLFQQAKIESLLDFSNLSLVFIITSFH